MTSNFGLQVKNCHLAYLNLFYGKTIYLIINNPVNFQILEI
jgi:hypothetical protein